MANTLSKNQVYAICNEIYKQATGQQSIQAVDTSSFVAMGTTLLATGYDTVSNAISQVLSRTIIDVPMYNRKLRGLKADSIRFGNMVRRISIQEKSAPFETDHREPLTDGQSVDMYTINKPKAVQVNWYGQNVYEKSITIYKDQLDVAFSSEAEFAKFIACVMRDIQNKIEKIHEEEARATLANMIGAKVLGDNTNVFYLFDLYYTETGVSLTASTYKDPQYYPDFCKWAFGFINTISDLMEEYSNKFHINIASGDVVDFTPKKRQKMYLYAPEINQISARIYSSIFSPEFIKYVDFEKVNFWQNINDPMKVQVKPSYQRKSDGVAVVADNAVTVNNIFGVLFDEEACGFTTINEWASPTPFNSKGGYQNIFYHFTNRPVCNMFKNFCLFLLDNAPEYDLTVTKGSHTNLTIKVNGTSISASTASDAYKLGDTIEITASAGSGYTLTTFTVNGDDVEGGSITLQADGDLTIVTAATQNA